MPAIPYSDGANVPDADRSGVKSHLQMDAKFYTSSKSHELTVEDEYIDTAILASVLEVKGRVLAIVEELVIGLSHLHGRPITAARTLEPTAKTPNGRVKGADDTHVAVIPLKGVLRPGPSLLGLLFGGGGGGLAAFRSGMREAAADPKVSAIVMDVDSPGGFVDLIPETAAEIRSIRAEKPVVAVANTTAGSAAYWLASQASQVVASPSSEVGSIGVYQIHENISDALAQQGIEVTIIKAGKYKVEGHPFAPLDSEATDAMQADVDGYYDMFTADVAKGRGVDQTDVRSGYGEGRMLLAQRAVKAGLADRVDTLGNTVKRLAHPGARAALQHADAEALQTDPPEALEPPSDVIVDVPRRLTSEERDRVLSALAG